MANHPAEGNIVMLNIRIATPPFDRATGGWMKVNPGIVSSYTFNLKPGDKAIISGPYGEFYIQETEREMCYIGGGGRMAPLRSHVFHLFHTLGRAARCPTGTGRAPARSCSTRNISMISKSASTIFPSTWPCPSPCRKTTGPAQPGFIHQVVLDNYLSEHPAPEDIEYYLCGPPMMLQAVMRLLDDLGVEEEMIRFDDFG